MPIAVNRRLLYNKSLWPYCDAVKRRLQHATIKCDNESNGKLFTPSFATVRGLFRSDGIEGHVVECGNPETAACWKGSDGTWKATVFLKGAFRKWGNLYSGASITNGPLKKSIRVRDQCGRFLHSCILPSIVQRLKNADRCVCVYGQNSDLCVYGQNTDRCLSTARTLTAVYLRPEHWPLSTARTLTAVYLRPENWPLCLSTAITLTFVSVDGQNTDRCMCLRPEHWPLCMSTARKLTTVCVYGQNTDCSVCLRPEHWPLCVSTARTLTAVSLYGQNTDRCVCLLPEHWPLCLSTARTLTAVSVYCQLEIHKLCLSLPITFAFLAC